MKKNIVKLNESQLKNIISEAIKGVVNEKVAAKKLMQVANQHGGLSLTRPGAWGNTFSDVSDYISQMPDDCVLGVGHTDLSIWPHEEFEIDGVPSSDMGQIQLRDGSFLYYNRKRMNELFGDERKRRYDNDRSWDGAFRYDGKHTEEIRKKQMNFRSEGYPIIYKIDGARQSIFSAKNAIEELKNTHFSQPLDNEIDTILSNLDSILSKLKEIENNADDNLYNPWNDDGGHFWHSGQDNNVTKTMKPRDSRTPSGKDIQNTWGHDKTHPNKKGFNKNIKTYPYR